MKLTTTNLKLAGALAIALISASPIATAASAATMHPVAMQYGGDHRTADNRYAPDNRYAQNDRDNVRFGYDMHKYRDRYHQPPVRFERAPVKPHGNWHFVAGHWRFHNDHWMWIGAKWVAR